MTFTQNEEDPNIHLVVGQFWGRAAEASWAEKSRALFYCLSSAAHLTLLRTRRAVSRQFPIATPRSGTGSLSPPAPSASRKCRRLAKCSRPRQAPFSGSSLTAWFAAACRCGPSCRSRSAGRSSAISSRSLPPENLPSDRKSFLRPSPRPAHQTAVVR